MKQEQKIRALSRLASIRSDAKLGILKSKFQSIEARLRGEADYNQMKEGLAELEAISIRFPDETVEIVSDMLVRVKAVDNPDEPTTETNSERDAKSIQLAQKCFDVLDRIRYLSINLIIPLLFKYVSVGETSVREKASKVLSDLTEFNLTVIYGDDQQNGIGYFAQIKLNEAIIGLTEAQLRESRPAVQLVAEQLLSPTMEKTSSDYKSFTWTNAAVPADAQVKELRENAIEQLIRLYAFTDSIGEKKSILNALLQATRTHLRSDYGEDVREMIADNVASVLYFFRQLVTKEPLQIVQKIEHDSYWQHRRGMSEAIKKSALEVKAEIDALTEYKIYKVLVGFEGIFGDWDNDDSSQSFLKIEEYRNKEAKRFAESITEQSYPEWRERITRFATTESNDLATFPVFGVFLEHFALVSPSLAIRLLRENFDDTKKFLVSILLGLWKGNGKSDAQSFVSDQIKKGENLWSIASIIQWLPNIEMDLLQNVTRKAMETCDIPTLNRLICSIGAKANEENAEFIGDHVVIILQKLTELGASHWVHEIWFRPEWVAVMSALSEDGIDVILENLLLAEKIEYHIESILLPLGKTSPDKVLSLFERRLAEQAKREDKYDAIPFSFHELQKAFADKAGFVVGTVRSWYNGDDLFRFDGADLVAKLFPDFSDELESELIQLAATNDEIHQKFVIAILHNYNGNNFIFPVCKALVIALPEDSNLLNEVVMALRATGVVSGEFGFAVAYEKKIEGIAPWLEQTEDPKVRNFAQRYTASLQKQAKAERQRAEEELEIRKHEWGDNSEDNRDDNIDPKS